MNVNPFSYLIEKLKGKVDKSGDTMSGTLVVDKQDGTVSTEGYSYLVLGNDKATGTDKNSTGILDLFGDTGNRIRLYANQPTATRYIGLPDKAGTLALTSDIPIKIVQGNLPNDIGSKALGSDVTLLSINENLTGYVVVSVNAYVFGQSRNIVSHFEEIAVIGGGTSSIIGVTLKTTFSASWNGASVYAVLVKV